MLLAVAMVFGLSGMTAFADGTDGEEPATIAADADSYNVKYAVTLWGINQDTDQSGHTLGLTFGPATGADYVNTYNAHLTEQEYDAGGICLHWMSWEEIAEQSRIDPTVFEDCLENGCTHSVDITLNDTLLAASYAGQMGDGDGAGVLSESIGANYRTWNSDRNATGGYPASQVRAVLNGKDDLMGGYAKYALDESDCLFSCFPADLRDAIVTKAVKSDTDYASLREEYSETTYDRLWLFSGKEVYAESGLNTNDPVIRPLEGELYQRSERLGITTSDYSALINYAEDGKTRSWWLRSLTQANTTQVYLVMTGGVPNYYDTTNTTVGLAPGFCLAGQADKTELAATIEAAEALTEWDYTSDSWAVLLKALDAAYVTMDKEGLTQKEVDDAQTDLQDAIDNLETPADKTELAAMIAEAEETMSGLDKNAYTVDSWEALEESLAAAKAVMEDPDATQRQADAARDALLDALEHLTLADEQAFAVYSVTDNSLTFYTGIPPAEGTYQDKAATTVYTEVDSIDASDVDDIPWYDLRGSVTSVVIDTSFSRARPVSLAYWFDEFENASFEGLEYMDTSDVTTLYYTFRDCKHLTRLDLSGWDVSRVRNMNSLFYDCGSLVSVGDLSGWDTSNNTTLFSMFSGCEALTGVDLSGWDTSKVVNMSSLFYDCPSLTGAGDLSGWNTSENTSMYGMFYNCSSLTGVDLSGWDTKNVTTMQYMFRDCSSLTGVGDLSGWDTGNVTTMAQAFYNCKKLTSLNVADWNTQKVTDVSYAFGNCSGLTTLDLSGWDTTGVAVNTNFATGCSALQWVKIGNKTTVFTLGKCVSQQNWYSSSTNGKLVSNNYLQDVKEAGQYWTYTDTKDTGGSNVKTIEKIGGTWTYTVNGTPDYTYTGFGENSNGKWYVKNGKVLFDTTDILKDTTGAIGTKGDWYYVIDSKVQETFTGLSNFRNANGWWYIVKGKVDFSHNGVDKNKNGWYYVTSGKVQFGFTGLANYKNANGWWYIKGGKVDFTHNGVDKNKNGWYYVTGGKVQFGYSGVANYKNANGWWCIKSGKVDFSFTGIASNRNGTWYVKNGKVDFSYSGTVWTSGGKRYTVTKGKVS